MGTGAQLGDYGRNRFRLRLASSFRLIAFAGAEKGRAVLGKMVDQRAPNEPYQGGQPKSHYDAQGKVGH